MAINAHPGELTEKEAAQLRDSPHWQLVERIVASSGFERATQLRNLLRYISQKAILQPDVVLREYDIACDVLGRRLDFDPSRDNIARAQISHLRRKLEAYFSGEGKDERLVLTIQKGSYTPLFKPAHLPVRAEVAEDPAPVDVEEFVTPVIVAPEVHPPVPRERRRSLWKWGAVLALIFVGAAGAFFAGKGYTSVRAKVPEPGPENAFVRFLGRTQGDVTIVTPDLSLVLVRRLSGAEISVSDYTSPDYPDKQLASIKDPMLRSKIRDLATLPNTTFVEALIGFDFKDTLRRVGVHSVIRYARDLHVQDLSQENSILVGGNGSNVWTFLFADKMNFHFIELNDHVHYFENERPQPGELPRYPVVYPTEGKVSVGYVDVALAPNPTRSGYILLINGSDSQVSEAATRFLLHGHLPQEIESVLNRKDLRYFELFLRGKHVGNEAEDSVDLVAVRQ